MSPGKTQQLVAALRAFYQESPIRQKDLAAALDLSPQALNEILAERNKPNSETTLRILEFLKTENMKPDLFDPPRTGAIAPSDLIGQRL
jgi:DNA-binding XRE family transcriptional regulator